MTSPGFVCLMNTSVERCVSEKKNLLKQLELLEAIGLRFHFLRKILLSCFCGFYYQN